MSSAGGSPCPIASALGQRVTELTNGWQLVSVEPDAVKSPDELGALDDGAFRPAIVPGTVASARGGREGVPLDAQDHWYRVRLSRPATSSARRLLAFDGLATLAEAWLDGAKILDSDDMFVAHTCDVTSALAAREEHELCLRFRSLATVLKERRPRGRWPTRLVSQKSLRFVRTSFLGYMPGWYPACPPIGPWRSVRLIEQEGLALDDVTLRARLDGSIGVLRFRARGELLDGGAIEGGVLRLEDGEEVALVCTPGPGTHVELRAELRVPNVEPWWPHTHGTPARHRAEIRFHRAGRTESIDLGLVGFRRIEVDRGTDGDGFSLRINGRPVFCRGACWSPLDTEAIHVAPDVYRRVLENARDAGMNMIRVGGTMAYEHDAFYETCDALGILVWQDFMFANFDYPVEDEAFLTRCREESLQILRRLGSRPSLAVLCGGSEVAQQAAMMGAPAAEWSNILFDRVLPDLAGEQDVDAAYVPSSPSGGALPFHVDQGVGHYYGVGAYRRPLTDARVARVRFASECLAFSNVPEPLETVPSPRSSGVPHDPGAEWDFADVADHYLEMLYDVNARALREADPERYLALSRAATGEVMANVIGTFRRPESECGGALVWLLRDPSQGAGWGVIDCGLAPKAAYHYLARACSPRALWLTDEGVNGVAVHLANERPEPSSGRIEVALLREDGKIVERGEIPIALDGGSQGRWNVEGILGRFADASYAYRFGPPGHDVVVARLRDDAGRVLAQAFHLPRGLRLEPSSDLGLRARATPEAGGVFRVDVETDRFAQSVRVDVQGYRATDSYFHVAPDVGHTFRIVPIGPDAASRPEGHLRALNAPTDTPLLVEP